MTHLLFPGRHLLHTSFQARYLQGVLGRPLADLDYYASDSPPQGDPIDQIVFAITSSNQAYSRYNPIPFHVRSIGVDRFAQTVESACSVGYHIFGIPHYRQTPRFAKYILREIEEQSEGQLSLSPDNCLVLCSTPEVIALFRHLGFTILPAEFSGEDSLTSTAGSDSVVKAKTPIQLLQYVENLGPAWTLDPHVRRELHPVTFDLWHDFPEVPRRVMRLWRDPLLTDSGGLTDTRDYALYTSGMSNQAIIDVKYDDIKKLIRPGKIVDEGCADGALLARIARGFPDSDLIGIDITGEFIARAKERQRAGEFGGSFVHFHQRNITQPIFEANSIDTTICNSTMHELWSYGDREKSIGDYLRLKYRQCRRGGRLIIRDVVGPADKEQEVVLQLTDQDGSNEDIFLELADRKKLETHLTGLSTYARFRRFARDFLADMRAKGRREPETAVTFREESIADDKMIILPLRLASEFLSKKDYVGNWDSEMHEEFAFWDFTEWKAALSDVGFYVLENPNDMDRSSRVYASPWIVKHRYRGQVSLHSRLRNGHLESIPYPVTNIVLVGEK